MSEHTTANPIPSLASAKFQLSSAKSAQAGFARDVAMDFTKGALVLFMVLYHWLNYFIGSEGHYYNYLRFLTPSFIFISGFMISQIHLPRHETNGRSLAKRLIVRGIKLLAVFFALNLLISLISLSLPAGNTALGRSLHNLSWAFVVANPSAVGGQKGISFSMLVPISYLLILSALLAFISRSVRQLTYAFRYTLLLLVMIIILLISHNVDSSYLDLLMVGTLGIVIGFARKNQINSIISHPYVLIVLYCIYLSVISFVSVSLPLQVVSVILTTALLYIMGKGKTVPSTVHKDIVLLGKYSLLGYISQIAILQGLRRFHWLSQHGVGALLLSLFLGILLTWIVVRVTDIMIRKSRVANSLYRLVFA